MLGGYHGIVIFELGMSLAVSFIGIYVLHLLAKVFFRVLDAVDELIVKAQDMSPGKDGLISVDLIG
jgi:hypothetical protein